MLLTADLGPWDRRGGLWWGPGFLVGENSGKT